MSEIHGFFETGRHGYLTQCQIQKGHQNKAKHQAFGGNVGPLISLYFKDKLFTIKFFYTQVVEHVNLTCNLKVGVVPGVYMA